MGRIYLGIGTRFLLHGRAFEITEQIEQDKFKVKDLEFSGVFQEYSGDKIRKSLESGELIFSEKGKNTTGDLIKTYDIDDIEMLPEKMQEEVKKRYNAIQPLINLEVEALNSYVQRRVEELSDTGINVSRASLYRWLKAYRESNEDMRSLVSGYHNRGSKGNRINGEVDVIIDQVINELYKNKEKITINSVFEMVFHKIDLNNELAEKKKLIHPKKEKLIHPSLSTVRRRVLEINSYDLAQSRNGNLYAKSNHGQVFHHEKPVYPLQRVEADHTKLDLFVVDDNTRLPIGRPYLTTILDVYTSYPLGIYIGFEPASYAAVMHALKHAIFPKTYIKEVFPKINGNWSAYGLPENLIVDNGKEFRSKHLKSACETLGINLVFCKVKRPWYKGAVERHYRTINTQLLHQTKGTTFSNILEKGDYDPKKNAVIGFKKLIEIIHVWIVDYYSNNFNKGVNGIPLTLWNTAKEFSPTPALPSSNLDWKISLMKISEGTIQRTGVRFNYLDYQSPKLWELVHLYRKKGKINKFNFKYDPSDISRIYVFNELNNKFIEAPCVNQNYSKGLNEYAHNMIRKKAKELYGTVNMSLLATAKALIIKLIEDEVSSTKTSLSKRKQNERMKGTGSNQVIEQKDNVNDDKKEFILNSKTDEVESGRRNHSILDEEYINDWGVMNGE